MSKNYRDQLSLPEALLWQRLRLRPLGPKFRKQHRIARLKLDFYCAERALAIEIDGISHDMGDRPEHDPRRHAWLRGQGIVTLRIAASDVLRDADAVAEAVARYALTLPAKFAAPKRTRRGAAESASDEQR